MWIDSLAVPDVALSIFAGAVTFYAFRLSPSGVTGDILRLRTHLTKTETFFFSPTGQIIPIAHAKPAHREHVQKNSFQEGLRGPIPGRGMLNVLTFVIAPCVTWINM